MEFDETFTNVPGWVDLIKKFFHKISFASYRQISN